MKVLVPVKRVIDYNVKVRVKSDQTGVDLANVKMSMNPFDEIAVEEAIRLKEAGKAEEVIVVSVGGDECQQQLRTGLAMGADRAILVQTDAAVPPLSLARIFRQLIDKEQPFLVLLGKQAIDDDNGQTPQMLAALWDRPQAVSCSKIEVADGKATVTREVDAGLEVLEVDLPAVFTAQKGLAEARYPGLKGIMAAKRKPVDKIEVASLGVDESSGGFYMVERLELPPEKAAGTILQGEDDAAAAAAELVKLLREEAKAI